MIYQIFYRVWNGATRGPEKRVKRFGARRHTSANGVLADLRSTLRDAARKFQVVAAIVDKMTTGNPNHERTVWERKK